jgi:hypothetical protein
MQGLPDKMKRSVEARGTTTGRRSIPREQMPVETGGYVVMNRLQAAEYRDVVETVRQWPPEARRDLVREVSRTLDEERPTRRRRGYSADEVIRTLKSDRPAPSDEECDRILEEELMRKYGS